MTEQPLSPPPPPAPPTPPLDVTGPGDTALLLLTDRPAPDALPETDPCE